MAQSTAVASGTADILRLKDRIWEADLTSWRGYRIQALQDWKNRLQRVDQVYRGAWQELFSDESMAVENPFIMNMVQVGMDDTAKLVSESSPTNVSFPHKDTKAATVESHIREAINDTYWEVNRGADLVPLLSMDIQGSGAAFIAAYIDKKRSKYPLIHRIDPRYAYPDVLNGVLQDLIVLEDINYRVAAREYPSLGLDNDPDISNKFVEMLHYYSAKLCIQAVIIKPSTNAAPTSTYIVNKWDPKGVLPVVMGKLDTFDGHFRGMFDQVIGSLQVKNRITKQVLDYTDEIVYAPKEELGVLNPDAVDGPGTVYHLDPTVPGAGMRRVPPASPALEVLKLLDYIDRENRGATTYPAARQGEVTQSIASASFVASTMGSLTSTVRNIQRLIGSMRQELNKIFNQYDENFLNFEKPMCRPIGKKMTYTPKVDIAEHYECKVVYGASAGLDRMTADTRVMQHVGNGLVSRQTGREQLDYIPDPLNEQARIEVEQTTDILKQKLLTEADVPTMLRLVSLQSDGLTLAEAAAVISKEQQDQAQQAQPGQMPPGAMPGATPGPEAAPTSVAQQGEAIQAGATQPQAAPQFAPPPSEAVMVGRQAPGHFQDLGQ